MNKKKCIDKIMRLLKKEQNEMDFKDFADMQLTLEYCKEILKKKQSEHTNNKVKSRKITEWKEGWFGK